MRDLAKLPKCELHVHLEGAMRTTTLVELCKKHGVAVPPDPRGKSYSNFDAFAACYRAACECLREKDDVHRIVLEFAEDALDAGCHWVEVAPSLQLWCDRFGGMEQAWLLLLEAAEAAEAALGGKVAIAYIAAAERHEPVENAESLATIVASIVDRKMHMINGRNGIVAFGLHSAEPGNPPQPFAEAFKIARACGLRSCPHAGEIAPGDGVSGVDSVLSAVDDLHAHRIHHGTLCHTDDALVARLIQEEVCLDMCPTSNVLLGVVPSVEEHPLPVLLRKGVHLTINSDDPLLFGPRLLEEFNTCRDKLLMTDKELAQAARYSFQHSCAPEAVKAKGIAEIEIWMQ